MNRQDNQAEAMFIGQVLDTATEQGAIDRSTTHPVVLTVSLVFDGPDYQEGTAAANAALDALKLANPIEGVLKFAHTSIAAGAAIPGESEESTGREATGRQLVEQLSPVLDQALGQIAPNLPTLEDVFATLRHEARMELD